MKEKLGEVLAFLEELRPGEDFVAAEDFVGQGLLDSYDILMLVAHLDKRYSIAIAGIDIVPENLQNLGSIERLLERYGVAL